MWFWIIVCEKELVILPFRLGECLRKPVGPLGKAMKKLNFERMLDSQRSGVLDFSCPLP